MGTDSFVFTDDIILFSSSAEERAGRLERVLQRFDRANLQLHPPNVCSHSHKWNTEDLCCRRGVAASPEKVKAVQNFPTPTCVKDVRSFLGLTSFYRRLVPKFAEIVKPLTSITRKDQPFTWGPSQQEAFRKLKEKLCTTPVLNFPEFSFDFYFDDRRFENGIGRHFVAISERRVKAQCLCQLSN